MSANTQGFTLSASKKALLPLLCILLSACTQASLVGDINAGQKKSAVCGMCHGQDGISLVPIYPNLAGQKEAYLVLQLKAFRQGERVNMAMTSHAQKLSDQDIADLAAYYAALEPRGELALKETK